VFQVGSDLRKADSCWRWTGRVNEQVGCTNQTRFGNRQQPLELGAGMATGPKPGARPKGTSPALLAA